ncbi:hypothetical protein Indivirus_5_47 [Indivirus ILV1]|uniref:Uncharacterized protein n=1 Tax=Indivirus ILV1 TaxID=1977633 RepID=A0A1V0SE78_9VIRU|nr:hypothetical protein Indivirus_5_47 [Indivirus ILV1]
MCDNCDYNSGDIDNQSLKVCKKCFNTKPSLLITKSGAMEKYPLGKNDFDDVRYIEYKGTYITYLYLIKDIEYLCIKKYGSKENSLKIMENKLNKKTKRQEYNNKLKKIRYNELNDYLKSICLPGIRSDSALCENYISHGESSGFTKEDIGIIMTEMKFFYEKTNYSTYLYQLRNQEISEQREYGGWYRWTEDDEDCIRQEAKNKALYEYIKKNDNNNHNIILEIPKSLKQKADSYYEKLCKKDKIGIKKNNTLQKSQYSFNDIYSKFIESNKTFNKTMEEYNNLIKKSIYSL